MDKYKRRTLTRLETRDKKVTATSKLVDQTFDKVGIQNLNALIQNSANPDDPVILPVGDTQVHTLSRATTVYDGKKKVVLPRGSIVRGRKFPSRNQFSFIVESLTKRNQKKVFHAIGTKTSRLLFTLDTKNKTKTPLYTKNTAFAHQGTNNLPDLHEKNLQSYFDGDRRGNPFLTITADNYLNYYTNYLTNSNKTDFSKFSKSVKIKKFTRSRTVYTYYLAKPIKTFGTKRVRVGHKTLYRLKVSLGHVFRCYDNYNLDPGSYRITVNVGSKKFYVQLGYLADVYAETLSNNVTDIPADPVAGQAYVQSLQK